MSVIRPQSNYRYIYSHSISRAENTSTHAELYVVMAMYHTVIYKMSL